MAEHDHLVVVVIEGGCVQSVSAGPDVDVVIVDWDEDEIPNQPKVWKEKTFPLHQIVPEVRKLVDGAL